MTIYLRYWDKRNRCVIQGGTYADWKQMLALIPNVLLDHKWKIQTLTVREGGPHVLVWVHIDL